MNGEVKRSTSLTVKGRMQVALLDDTVVAFDVDVSKIKIFNL